MKIGILTMHRVIHFGSVLQAYALQRILFELGYPNEIIDYVYPNEFHLGKQRKNIRTRISEALHSILPFTIKKTENKIQSFIDNDLIKSSCCYKSPESIAKNYPEYDVYITGSDQVWNTDYLKGDKTFFFNFLPKKAIRISYASSFGRFSFEGNQAKKWLNDLYYYKAISVRENKAQAIIKSHTGIDSEIVLDPTLLLTKDDWISFADTNRKIGGDYILVYMLTYAWQPFPYALNVIEHFEKKTGYKVVVIEPLWLQENKSEWIYLENQSPQEFVNLFLNAKLVLTSSFHGTVFSINLERPFYSLVKENNLNDDRIVSICTQLDLSNNLLYYNTKPHDLPKSDFSQSRVKLNQLRKKSIHYIQNSLNNPDIRTI